MSSECTYLSTPYTDNPTQEPAAYVHLPSPLCPKFTTWTPVYTQNPCQFVKEISRAPVQDIRSAANKCKCPSLSFWLPWRQHLSIISILKTRKLATDYKLPCVPFLLLFSPWSMTSTMSTDSWPSEIWPCSPLGSLLTNFRKEVC